MDYSNVSAIMSEGLSTAIPTLSEGVSEALPIVQEGVAQAAAAAIPIAEQASAVVAAQTGIPKNAAKWAILGIGLYFGWGMVKGLIKPALLAGGGYLLYKKMGVKPMSLNSVGYPTWRK
jgi:hypothetical protein